MESGCWKVEQRRVKGTTKCTAITGGGGTGGMMGIENGVGWKVSGTALTPPTPVHLRYLGLPYPPMVYF
jgi:hypothetical protein